MKRLLLISLTILISLPLSAQNRKKEIARLDSINNVLSLSLSELQQKYDALDSSYNASTEILQRKVSILNEAIDRLSKSISQQATRIHSLESDLDAMKKGELDEFIVNPISFEDSVIFLVQSFYGAKRWSDQTQFVLYPDRVEPLMRRYYNSGYYPEKIKKSQISLDDDSLAFGAVMRVDADIHTTYIKRIPEGLKIDWQATTGTDEYSFEAFMAEKSTVTRQFRVTARLGSDYASDYGISPAKFYCVRIGENAYVSKTSDVGKQIYDVINDGYGHDLILQVRYEKKSIKSGYSRMFPIIVGFVKEGWSLEEE